MFPSRIMHETINEGENLVSLHRGLASLSALPPFLTLVIGVQALRVHSFSRGLLSQPTYTVLVIQNLKANTPAFIAKDRGRRPEAPEGVSVARELQKRYGVS